MVLTGSCGCPCLGLRLLGRPEEDSFPSLGPLGLSMPAMVVYKHTGELGVYLNATWFLMLISPAPLLIKTLLGTATASIVCDEAASLFYNALSSCWPSALLD